MSVLLKKEEKDPLSLGGVTSLCLAFLKQRDSPAPCEMCLKALSWVTKKYSWLREMPGNGRKRQDHGNHSEPQGGPALRGTGRTAGRRAVLTARRGHPPQATPASYSVTEDIAPPARTTRDPPHPSRPTYLFGVVSLQRPLPFLLIAGQELLPLHLECFLRPRRRRALCPFGVGRCHGIKEPTAGRRGPVTNHTQTEGHGA